MANDTINSTQKPFVTNGLVSNFNPSISAAETFRQISSSVTDEQVFNITKAILGKRTKPAVLYIRVTNNAGSGADQAFRIGDPDNFSAVSNGVDISFETNFKPSYAKLLEYLQSRKLVTVGVQTYVNDEGVYDKLNLLQKSRDFDRVSSYDMTTDLRLSRTKRTNDEPKIRNLDVAMVLSDDLALIGQLGFGKSIEFTFDLRAIYNY